MELSFKKHSFNEGEKIWLAEVAKSSQFDVKVAKVRLREKLPKNFDPNKIDSRLYANKRLTLIGIWYVDPNNSIFGTLDKVIKYIRSKIFEDPGVEQFTADSIAEYIGVDRDEVARALYELGQLNGFFSSASGSHDKYMFDVIQLTGDDSYDKYLNYEGLEEVIERVYIERNPDKYQRMAVMPIFPRFSGDEVVLREQIIETKSFKPNSAFVLMAIDPLKPDLEDVYNSIKEVCHEFGINAYRADDIEHQDKITDRILEEIQTCEYLIADLTFERPNVYYEVGYAHAVKKKPILYRKKGTRLHFDLAVHNVPEYENITELKEKLRGRFEAIIGRGPKV